MEASEFASALRTLIEEHGTEHYIAEALDEFDLTYIEDTPDNLRAWIVKRATALYEEDR